MKFITLPKIILPILIFTFTGMLFFSSCSSTIRPFDAKNAFDRGDFQHSVEMYKELLEESPYNREYRYWLAVSYFKSGMLRESMQELETILRSNENDLRALALKSEIYLGSGQIALSQAVLRKIIESHPDDIKSYIRLSQIFRAKEQPEIAIVLLRKAESIDKDVSKVYSSLYELYSEDVKDDFLSYYYLRRLWETAPNKSGLPDVQHHLQNMEKENPDLKIKYFDHFLLENAAQNISAKRFLDAETELNKVQNKDADWSKMIGEVYLETDRPFEAQIQLEKHLQTNPDDIQANYLIGWAYLRMGSKDIAIEHWKKVLLLDPGNKKARFAIQGATNP